MEWFETALPDVWRIELTRHGDARGFFARLACEETFRARGLSGHFVQMNMSLSARAGTLRGLHYQRPPAAEAKLVRCIRGAVLDVVVDLRAGSPTYGQHITQRLDDDARAALYIPEGCAHGFQTLTDDAEMLYFHSAPHAPEHEGGIDPLDPALGIAWPLPVTEMSARDRAHPPLARTEPIET